jgi:hypothetical protein
VFGQEFLCPFLPLNPVLRQQMAAFLLKNFALQLY